MVAFLSDMNTVLFASTAAVALLGAGYGVGRFLQKAHDDQFTTLINEMTDGYYRTSLDGKLLLANPALSKLMGYNDQEELLAETTDVVTKWYVDSNRRNEFAHELDEHGRVEKFRSQIYTHNGKKTLWVSESARLVVDSFGQPSHYEGTVREISDTMRKLELENSHRKFAENIPGVMFQARWTSEGVFSLPHRAAGFRSLFGDIPVDDLSEDSSYLKKMVHPDDHPRLFEAAEKSITELSEWNEEFRFNRADGTQIWLHLKATPELEDDGSCFWHGFVMDITDRKLSERRIHDLAYFDALTKLPNRRMLLEKLSYSLRNCRAFGRFGALMYIDIDNFKTLNDSNGHGGGDQLLQEMARRLNNCVDEEDTVARFGGDEFVILLDDLGSEPEVAKETAQRIANHILKSVAQPAELEEITFQATCSIGIELFDDQHALPHEILRRADTALYASKDNGRNCATFYCQSRQEELDRSAGLMKDLRDALNTEQLKLHYQMQVDPAGKVVGAEALLRWEHPTQGMIPPGQFIPDAESSGLIIPITEWILREAFQTLRSWRTDVALSKVQLSINVSARQFHEHGFVQDVKNLVEEFEVDPSRLVLEMTEHVLSHDTQLVRSVMMDLKDIGVGFSLDDFGTGYSSLVHMRELPFDEVKIDGKFICDLEENQNDRAITRSIIAMANALDLETVAEWVETDAQREFLKDQGCTRMQGFLFGPALPITEFEHAASKAFFKQASKPKLAARSKRPKTAVA